MFAQRMDEQSDQIFTLSIGHYSNFVSTHYFNILKEDDVDKFDKGSLFKNINQPRLLSIDSRGAYSYERKHQPINQQSILTNPMLESPKKKDISNVWGGGLKIYDQNVHTQNNNHNNTNNNTNDNIDNNNEIDLDAEVGVWSHYINYEHKDKNFKNMNSVKHEIGDFSVYDAGLEKMKEEGDEIYDAIHYWQEDCDRLRTIQLFADVDSGYSGVTELVLEYLREEYSKTPREYGLIIAIMNIKIRILKI
eukprot:TRINITY_DN7587_c0_g1_i1.p1 TRINITY_DN7587_c0_g1~~TRINITY_DN7587_c0_g1_i1.p1  ORF type:complete len:249 (+),score=43.76 TRINITY_DN7587_c0_g1_i1:97-843(+)